MQNHLGRRLRKTLSILTIVLSLFIVVIYVGCSGGFDAVRAPSNSLSLSGNGNPTLGNPLDSHYNGSCAQAEFVSPGIRILSQQEISNTLKDLLYFPNLAINAESLPRDSLNGLGMDNDGSAQNIFEGDAEKYFDAFSNSLDSVLNLDSPQVLRCKTPGTEACVDEVIRNFANRAFRRPVRSEEFDRLKILYNKNKVQGDFKASMKFVFLAALLSPNFLYLPLEGSLGQLHRLNGYEVAARLSYFLWRSMPDDTLLAAAGSGSLNSIEGIKQQTLRLIDDGRFAGFVDGFVSQWLELSHVEGYRRPQQGFEEFSASLRSDMVKETKTFFMELVKSDRPISEALDANYSFINKRLADLYGISGNFTNDRFERTPLPATQRRGIVGHASILTTTSRNDELTSPIVRGHWFTRHILCKEPPPPPANISFPDELLNSDLSRKEIMAYHRSQPQCAGCHALMDPIGITLENFDSIGRWRTSYGSKPVDATEVYPDGVTINGPDELALKMAEDGSMGQCFSRHLVSFAINRSLEPQKSKTDKCLDQNIASPTPSIGGSSIKDYILRTVLNRAFTHQVLKE